MEDNELMELVGVVNTHDEAIVKIAEAIEKAVVEIENLKEICLKQAEGLDEIWDCLNKDVFEPFDNLSKRKEIETIKGGLSAREGLEEYVDFYAKIYEGKDLLEDIASEMLEVKASLGEGEEFNEDDFINGKLASLDNSMIALGLKEAKEEEEAKADDEGATEPTETVVENEGLSPEDLAIIEARKNDM